MSSHTSIWIRLIFLPFALLTIHLEGFQKSDVSASSLNGKKCINIFLPTLNAESLTADTMPFDLVTYYKYTNLAARAIYNNNFNTASVYYDSAFIYKQYPFYEDLKKFILVNYKSGLFDKNEQAIFHLIQHKKIDTAQLFTVLPKRVFDDKNLKLINKLIKERNKTNLQISVLAQTLKEIYYSDQSVRDYNLFKQKSIVARNAIYSSRDSVDAVNFIRFEKLYAQYGFPDEESVGVFYDDESQWVNIISILLLHFSKSRDSETAEKLNSILKAALNSGELHNAICASLLEENNVEGKDPINRYYYLSTTINLVMGEVYRPFVFYTDSLMNEVNANRIAIGLDSFHVTQKQVVCQFIGAKADESKNIITMVPYASIDDLPPGLVKMTCEEAKVDYHSYKINTAKILAACKCEEKAY